MGGERLSGSGYRIAVIGYRGWAVIGKRLSGSGYRIAVIGYRGWAVIGLRLSVIAVGRLSGLSDSRISVPITDNRCTLL